MNDYKNNTFDYNKFKEKWNSDTIKHLSIDRGIIQTQKESISTSLEFKKNQSYDGFYRGDIESERQNTDEKES